MATRCTNKWSQSRCLPIAQSGLKRVLPSYFSRSYHSTRETSDDSLQPPRARARFSKGEETKDLLGENSVQQLNMSWLELGAQSIKINLILVKAKYSSCFFFTLMPVSALQMELYTLQRWRKVIGAYMHCYKARDVVVKAQRRGAFFVRGLFWTPIRG